MTKKDYVLIAKVIANRFSTVDRWQVNDESRNTLTEIVTIAEDLTRALKADNPKFDRVKFITFINKMRTDRGVLN